MITQQWLQTARGIDREGNQQVSDDMIMKHVLTNNPQIKGAWEQVKNQYGDDPNVSTKMLNMLAGYENPQGAVPDRMVVDTPQKRNLFQQAYDVLKSPVELATGAVEDTIGYGLKAVGADDLGQKFIDLKGKEEMKQHLEDFGDYASVAVPMIAGAAAAPAAGTTLGIKGLAAAGSKIFAAGAAGGAAGSLIEGTTQNIKDPGTYSGGDLAKRAMWAGAAGGTFDAASFGLAKTAWPALKVGGRAINRAFHHADEAAEAVTTMAKNAPEVQRALKAGVDPSLVQFLGKDEHIFQGMKMKQYLALTGGDKVEAAKLLQKDFPKVVSNLQNKAYKKILESAVKSSGKIDADFLPRNVVGENMIVQLQDVLSGMKKVGADKAALISSYSDEVLDVTDLMTLIKQQSDEIAEAMTGNEKVLFDEVLKMIDDIAPDGTTTVGQLDKVQTRMFKQLESILADPSGKQSIRDAASSLKYKIRPAIYSKIDEVANGYQDLSRQYAIGSDSVSYWKKQLGLKSNTIEEATKELKSERLSTLARRLESNSIGGNTVAENLAKLDEAMDVLGIVSDMDIRDQALFSGIMEELFGIVKQNSLQGTLDNIGIPDSMYGAIAKLYNSIAGVPASERISVLRDLLK